MYPGNPPMPSKMENEKRNIILIKDFDRILTVCSVKISFGKTGGIKSNYRPSNSNPYVHMSWWNLHVNDTNHFINEKSNMCLKKKTPKSTKALNLRGIVGLLKNLNECFA